VFFWFFLSPPLRAGCFLSTFSFFFRKGWFFSLFSTLPSDFRCCSGAGFFSFFPCDCRPCDLCLEVFSRFTDDSHSWRLTVFCLGVVLSSPDGRFLRFVGPSISFFFFSDPDVRLPFFKGQVSCPAALSFDPSLSPHFLWVPEIMTLDSFHPPLCVECCSPFFLIVNDPLEYDTTCHR